MKLENFFEKFELFAEAPDAVAKMWELILLLSVRGNLSEQSASESCEEQLSTARAFAKRKATTRDPEPISAPFPIPENWGWVPVGHAMNLINGTAFKPENWTLEGTPIVRIQNLNNPDAPFNRFNGEIESKFYIHSGDFLISWSGTPGTSFGAFIWNRGKAILNQHIFRCELVEGVFLKEYLRLAVNARLDEMISRAHGAVGLRHITKGKLETIPLPLPPLAEQKRIVAKVDELMALCDRLEAQQLEREERASQIARASLARFADAPTPANLHFLFHPSYAIPPADLRKAILTLAVQGKLVPQDPDDIAVEDSVRAARKNEGLAVRALTELASEETPFETPDSWCWVTVADVADTRLGKMLDKEKNRGEAHPYLRNTNVHWFRFELESIKTMLFESSELDEYRVESGDVLICEGGHGIARSAVWDGQIPGIMFQKALHRVRPLSCLNGHFLTFCLWVYERDEILQRYYTGAGIPHFTGKALARVTFPLPPLAEQRRIVAKVEQLMALVDALETQLAASRTTAENLLTSLVAELTTS